MANQQAVQSKGIFHGLPVFSSSTKGLTAVITDANGISGNYMLRVLAETLDRWVRVYCLSRRPPAIPDGLPPQAEHIALDFLKEPEDIGRVMKDKGVRADYIFFYSYVQVKPKEDGGLWSDAEEMCRVNTALLRKFCSALPLASIKPKRIMLQTGAKNYGVHLGPSAISQEETAPRVTIEPNFYSPQEDFLWSFCAEQGIDWNKHLGETLDFPSDLQAWEANKCMSSSRLNTYMEEWAVLTDAAMGERFNTMDGTTFTWGNHWPKLAKSYGIDYNRPSMDESVYTIIKGKHDPPPRGFGPPGTYRVRFRLADWAKQGKVQKAWFELTAEHGLTSGGLQQIDIDRIFGFTDGSLMGTSLDLTMNKARNIGWHGFVDSNDAIVEVLGEFVKLKMLPPLLIR